ISKDFIFLELVLLSVGTFRIPFGKLLHIDFISKFFILIVNFVCDSLGFVSDIVVSTRGDFIRSSFGFTNPNTFGMILMILFFEMFILFPRKLKVIFPFALSTIIVNEVYADSRASANCMILFLVFFISYRFFSNFWDNKLISFFVVNSFAILFLFSIFITIFYSNLDGNVAFVANKWTSGRLSIQSTYWQMYPFSVFGNDIFFTRTLDNAYVKLFLKFGLFMSILYSFVFHKLFSMFYRNKAYTLIFALLCFTVYSLFESYSLYGYTNIFLLCFL
ncbi:TPA: hypothetical protein ACGOXX_002038, partial [Streptococcus suis]